MSCARAPCAHALMTGLMTEGHINRLWVARTHDWLMTDPTSGSSTAKTGNRTLAHGQRHFSGDAPYFHIILTQMDSEIATISETGWMHPCTGPKTGPGPCGSANPENFVGLHLAHFRRTSFGYPRNHVLHHLGQGIWPLTSILYTSWHLLARFSAKITTSGSSTAKTGNRTLAHGQRHFSGDAPYFHIILTQMDSEIATISETGWMHPCTGPKTGPGPCGSLRVFWGRNGR